MTQRAVVAVLRVTVALVAVARVSADACNASDVVPISSIGGEVNEDTLSISIILAAAVNVTHSGRCEAAATSQSSKQCAIP